VKKLFLLSAICLLWACSTDDKKPEGIYSIEKMADVMQDTYLLEAKIQELRLRSDSAKVVYNRMIGQLYEKHGVTDSLYEKSYGYYINEPEDLYKIYEIIADSLSLKERLLEIEEAEKK
jgi:ubiquinone biosynthesis protein Coq4